MGEWKTLKDWISLDLDGVQNFFSKDPFVFIESRFSLRPQKIKPQFKELLEAARRKQDYSKLSLEMFEEFVPGEMITRQQAEIVNAVKNAVNKEGLKRIAICSWNGIGKTSIMALLLLWFLIIHERAIVSCTWTSGEQLENSLWKELKSYYLKMPKDIRDICFKMTKGYLKYWRDKEERAVSYARYRTVKSARSESFSWVHADNLMVIVDEACSVPDKIFEVANWSLTWMNNIFVMLWNPLKNKGYFYDGFNKKWNLYQKLIFNVEDSPLVDRGYCVYMEWVYWRDSKEYKTRVLGQFC